MQKIVHLTTEQFVEKIDYLTNEDYQFGTSYDPANNQVQLTVDIWFGRTTVYVSPDMMKLPQAEWIAFRNELDRQFPEPDRDNERYW